MAKFNTSAINNIYILLCRGVSTYVGLYVYIYGSDLFNFGSYVCLPTLFACLLGFDISSTSKCYVYNVGTSTNVPTWNN